MTKAWKAHELRTARRLGGARNPLSGSHSRHSRGDIIHPSLYVECKYRKRFALLTLMRAVEDKAKDEKKRPVLVLQERNARQAYALIRLNDLEVSHEALEIRAAKPNS
jgi:hypothetical protein